MSFDDNNYLNEEFNDSDSDETFDNMYQIPQPPSVSPPPLPLENTLNTDMLENTQLDNPRNFSSYQSNVNSFYKKFTHDLTFCYRSVPLTFFMDYVDYSVYETSKKILLPKEILSKLTEYEELELPIYIKINDLDYVFGVIDYIEFIDHVYIPTPLFYDLNLKENEDIILTIMKTPPSKASKITIKPLNEEFYDLPDIKTYLEIWLKKMCITLHEGEIITLPYGKQTISLFIDSLEPESVVSIYEIEEVELDFLPMDEYVNKTKVEFLEKEIQPETPLTADTQPNTSNVPQVAASTVPQPQPQPATASNVFVPFSGKGNKLGSS